MNITDIDLRLLRYFLAVSEELNFTKAALRLHMSQPPLSQQIQELELRLETQLFTRTKRKVELTSAGQYLVPIVKKLLRDLEEGLHATRAVGRGHNGELKIGTIFSAPLVPSFGKTIQAFRSKHPSVRLSFRELRHAPILKALINHEIDIAFVWQIVPPTNKQLKSHILSTDAMSFYVAKNSPLSSKKHLDISDFSDEILFLSSLQMRMEFLPKLQLIAHQRQISLRISEEELHFPVIANLIAAGGGIGLLPDYVARLATTSLVAKKLKGLPSKELKLPLAVLYRGDDHGDMLSAFLTLL